MHIPLHNNKKATSKNATSNNASINSDSTITNDNVTNSKQQHQYQKDYERHQHKEHHANELKPLAEDLVKQENLNETNRRNASRKSIEKFQIGSKLGEGAFSIVYEATDNETKERVAIKVIKKYQLDEKQRNNVLKEVNLMKQLNHPNIVKLIDFVENDDYYYIIQELVSGGEIFNEIVKYTYFSEDLSRHVIIQVAEALLYMHEHVGIVHRDLKPENIFFKPIKFIKDDPKNKFKKLRKSDNPQSKIDEGKFIMNYGGAGIGIIKIGDFGLSKQIRLNENNALKTPCGTIGYTAPEIVRDMKYSKEVDMWALGCVLYILLCGFPPFFNDSIEELTRTVAKGEFKFLSPWWDEISSGAKNCVSRLLTVNPMHRYNVEQFLNDPWILEFLQRSENIQMQEKLAKQQKQNNLNKEVIKQNEQNEQNEKNEITENNGKDNNTSNSKLNEPGMPGLVPNNKLKTFTSYSQSLSHIDHMEIDDDNTNSITSVKSFSTKNDDNNMDEDSDSESLSSNWDNIEDGSKSEFGVELSRFHKGDEGVEPIPMLEHLLEPAPAQSSMVHREEFINDTTNQKRVQRNVKNGKIGKKALFTPEIMAMKDMFDISVAAHRMHEESKYTPNTATMLNNEIVEEDEDIDGQIIEGNRKSNSLKKENIGTFNLNINDASILARRQKKKAILA